MNKESLRASIEGLRAELERPELKGGAAAPTRERLRALLNQLEEALADEDEEAPHESVVDSVRDAIEQLESEHPRATSLLHRIMVSLGSSGI